MGTTAKASPARQWKVAAAQVLTGDNVAANARLIEKAITEAAGAGCRAVLFHEGALSGYPSPAAMSELKWPALKRAEGRIARLAGQLGIAVLVGTARREGGRAFNDLLIINERGEALGRYSKTWRAGEPWYAAGGGPVIFMIAGVQATAIICHDLRYPELVRLGVAAGARVVFIANNEGGLTCQEKLTGYRAMQISRATENYVYAVMCNAPADPADVRRHNASHGNSMIVDPLGNVLDEAGWFEQRLVTATLDLKQATGATVRRVLGEEADYCKLYGTTCEQPALRDWMKAGVKLVRRLEWARKGRKTGKQESRK